MTSNTSTSGLPPESWYPESEDMKNLLTPLRGFSSDELRAVFRYYVDLWICSILSYFGIGANVLNIIVFIKLGFQDTINISLTFIGAWDLLRCVCFAIIRLYGPIALTSEAFAESWNNLTFIKIGYTYTIAGFVSGVLAGYVAVERCLCISMPFTVKFLLTRKVVILANLVLSLISTASMVGYFILYTPSWTYSPKFNASIIIMRYSHLTKHNPSFDFALDIISMFWPILSFLVICVCTGIISVHLKRASKFRSSAGGDKNKQLSSRNKQVIKMLLVIIVVYIVCFLPRIVFYIPHLAVPDFKHGKRLENTMYIYAYFMSVFDLINSCVNIIIYYRMSSQFKTAFLNLLFSRCIKETGGQIRS